MALPQASVGTHNALIYGRSHARCTKRLSGFSATRARNGSRPDPQMASVKALVFDVFGTAVDWRTSVTREVEQLTSRKGLTVDGAKFSACMRKHGVTNFPDPDGQGVIRIHSGTGIDPGSPAFSSARTACEKLLPNGGQPTPAQIAQRQQQMLAFSACMRSHGLKDFPDPSNGGLRIQDHPGSDLDPNNPTFQKAQQACQGNLPFKGGASAAPGTAKAGGG